MTGETRLLHHTSDEHTITIYRGCFYRQPRDTWFKKTVSLFPGELAVFLSACQNERAQHRHLLTRHGIICTSAGALVTYFKEAK